MSSIPIAFDGACDCHFHVYEDGYPLAPTATFKPPHAPAEAYRRVQQELGLTRAVALEVARSDITCNAVCPGTVLTPAIERRLQNEMQRDGIAQDVAADRTRPTSTARRCRSMGAGWRGVDFLPTLQSLFTSCRLGGAWNSRTPLHHQPPSRMVRRNWTGAVAANPLKPGSSFWAVECEGLIGCALRC